MVTTGCRRISGKLKIMLLNLFMKIYRAEDLSPLKYQYLSAILHSVIPEDSKTVTTVTTTTTITTTTNTSYPINIVIPVARHCAVVTQKYGDQSCNLRAGWRQIRQQPGQAQNQCGCVLKRKTLLLLPGIHVHTLTVREIVCFVLRSFLIEIYIISKMQIFSGQYSRIQVVIMIHDLCKKIIFLVKVTVVFIGEF